MRCATATLPRIATITASTPSWMSRLRIAVRVLGLDLERALHHVVLGHVRTRVRIGRTSVRNVLDRALTSISSLCGIESARARSRSIASNASRSTSSSVVPTLRCRETNVTSLRVSSRSRLRERLADPGPEHQAADHVPVREHRRHRDLVVALLLDQDTRDAATVERRPDQRLAARAGRAAAPHGGQHLAPAIHHLEQIGPGDVVEVARHALHRGAVLGSRWVPGSVRIEKKRGSRAITWPAVPRASARASSVLSNTAEARRRSSWMLECTSRATRCCARSTPSPPPAPPA